MPKALSDGVTFLMATPPLNLAPTRVLLRGEQESTPLMMTGQ